MSLSIMVLCFLIVYDEDKSSLEKKMENQEININGCNRSADRGSSVSTPVGVIVSVNLHTD